MYLLWKIFPNELCVDAAATILVLNLEKEELRVDLAYGFKEK